MALKGNLRDFTITQLLNLVNLATKTGTLVVEGSGGVSRIAFLEGKLAYAQIGKEDVSLPAILHRNSKITRNQYNILKQRAGEVSDKELGILLINAGYVSQEDILVSLQQYFIGVVQRLFAWVEGYFRFEQDVLPPDGKIPVRIDLENLIIEGSRPTARMGAAAGRNPQPGYGFEVHRPPRDEYPRYQPQRRRMAGCILRQSRKQHPAHCPERSR